MRKTAHGSFTSPPRVTSSNLKGWSHCLGGNTQLCHWHHAKVSLNHQSTSTSFLLVNIVLSSLMHIIIHPQPDACSVFVMSCGLLVYNCAGGLQLSAPGSQALTRCCVQFPAPNVAKTCFVFLKGQKPLTPAFPPVIYERNICSQWQPAASSTVSNGEMGSNGENCPRLQQQQPVSMWIDLT